MCKKSSAGRPYPLGATVCENGINFAVFSEKAEHIILELYKKSDDSEPYQIFYLDPEINRTG